MGHISRTNLVSLVVLISTSVLSGCFELGDPVDKDPSPLSNAPPNDPPPANVNSAPTISGNPSAMAVVGTNWSFTPSVGDADGDVLSFSITNRPVWSSFNAATGMLSGTPQLGQEGSYANINISVSDGLESASLASFSVTVQNNSSNNAPTISGTAPTAVLELQPYSFAPTANDIDGDTLTFSIANRPDWTAFNSATGRLNGTPADDDAGSYANIVVSVTDGQLSSSLPAFSITVQGVNSAPVISGTPSPIATENQLYSFQPSAVDPDGDNLLFSISNSPAWATFNTATGELTGTPAVGDASTYANIIIAVSDGLETASLPSFSITVQIDSSNSAPTISGTPPTSVLEEQPYSFSPNANDIDGDTLTFSIANRPGWAAFNSATGQLSGTPADNDAGTYINIVVSVSDGQLSASLPAFSITVQGVNGAPVISGTPSPSATENQLYSFQPSASDPDGDNLSFSINNSPSWATFNTATGELSGTPMVGDASTYANIQISVSDGNVSASLRAFSITVDQTAFGSVTLTWNAPTLNTDGSPLTDLAAYKFYYGTSPGSYPNEIRVDNPGITTYVIDNLTANTYYIVSTSINQQEVESDFSNEAIKTVN